MSFIALEVFLGAITEQLAKDLTEAQLEAVTSPLVGNLMIVAGPGSGKTTALALRALKLLFVDGLSPETVLATTFTNRAAKQLRSRILGWGDQIKSYALSLDASDEPELLTALDLNAVRCGTLDSIAEAWLAKERLGEEPSPILVEPHVAETILLKRGVFEDGRHNDEGLQGYLRLLSRDAASYPRKMAETILRIKEKTEQDCIDFEEYCRRVVDPCPICGRHPHEGIAVVERAVMDYRAQMSDLQVADYAGLEFRLAELLSMEPPPDIVGDLAAVLVDEYQDTNRLQERIYFRLAAIANSNGGGITVVGDDDQALYRFRGTTVEVFSDFPQRLPGNCGAVSSVFLSQNFRSTEAIVDHCNSFVQADPDYATARVTGKPAIIFSRSDAVPFPVLGLFRDTRAQVAADLGSLLKHVFCGGGFEIPTGEVIQPHAAGDIGDCALLMASPRESTRAAYGQQPTARLPGLLRQQLTPEIEIFNPRGQDLAAIGSVGLLCGLVLECVDPQRSFEPTNLPAQVRSVFRAWRAAACAYLDSGEADPTLLDFVSSWRSRAFHRTEADVPMRELVYKLVAWIPEMQDDPEGLVYLEWVLRSIDGGALVGAYQGRIVLGTEHEGRSIRGVYWDMLEPLASGTVQIDEDLLDTVPRGRLNVMSIHQSKGLEFPMCVVDIGTDYTRDQWKQRYSRFPEDGRLGLTYQLEEELRIFSGGGDPLPRLALDRAFDDLIRLYFVAQSRAKDVLLLVGNRVVLDRVKCIQAGWRRDGTHAWEDGIPDLIEIQEVPTWN